VSWISRVKIKYRILIAIAPLVLVIDQIAKQMILSGFMFGESVSVIPGFFNLTYVRNTGAAFGIFASADPTFRVPFFLAIPFVAVFVIGYIFKRLPDNSLRLSSALSLIVAGALGNLIDRVNYGFVVDFLDFHWNNQYHFHVFNIADSAITVGVCLMLLDMVLTEKEGKG
jgi:signal peptidase II